MRTLHGSTRPYILSHIGWLAPLSPAFKLVLYAYPITHELWKEAMSMIDDAIEIVGTKSYIRFKHRKNDEVDGSLENIVLDIAGLEIDSKSEVKNESI